MPLWSCFTGQGGGSGQARDGAARARADAAASAAAAAAAAGLPAYSGPPLPDLSPFEALRPVGRGAVGEVFLARHKGDGQLYALKTVPLDAPSWRLELLKREERTYAALAAGAGAHVGLLRPCRMQLLPGRLCLVTEWASGGTLASFLSGPRFERGVDEALAAFMMRQLVDAVERLHTHRVAYRDIKLENILLDTATFGPAAPRLLLADFGTCKAWGDGEAGCFTSTFMGTPGFMAPQILGSIFPPEGPRRASASAPVSGLDDSAAMGSSCASEPSSSCDSGPAFASAPAAALAGGARSATSSAHSAPGGSAGVGAGVGAGAGGASEVPRYDAVKADVYSLGAILMFMLFKELPFGFDKFCRLLPPGEALAMLWQLEREKGWREAAGGAARLKRRASPAALDLLDRMLCPDEAARASLAEVRAHPWLAQRLPKKLAAALSSLGEQQAGLDAARAELLGQAPAAPPPGAPSGAEVALERLFEAAGDARSVGALRGARASLFVDLSPAGVSAAWELGLQAEGPCGEPLAALPGLAAPLGCGGSGGALGGEGDGACYGGGAGATPDAAAPGRALSVAGRSDSATSAELLAPMLGGCCGKGGCGDPAPALGLPPATLGM